jgi:hypothetical protein
MKDKKASPKNKKQVLRQQRQEKGRRQKYLRISIFVIGLALVAGYMLWPQPSVPMTRGISGNIMICYLSVPPQSELVT